MKKNLLDISNFFLDLPLGSEFQATIQSNSMSPLFKIGDDVLVKKIKFAQVKIGDIICFYQDFQKSLIIHRVIKKEYSKNNKNSKLITKGDASPIPDHKKVNKQIFIGLVVSKLKNKKKISYIKKLLSIFLQK